MIWQSHSWSYPDITTAQKDTCSPCSQQYYSQQPRCGQILDVHRQRDKEDVVLMEWMEYYLVMKRVTIAFAAAWIDLEIIIFNEVSQKEKDKHHMISKISCKI